MKKSIIIPLLILILISLTGCVNSSLKNPENQDLLVELREENLELKETLDEKDDEIKELEKLNSKKDKDLIELRESLKMVSFSSYARQADYSDIFDYLSKKYKIYSDFEILDEWYVISDDYFEIELLGFEDAVKVDFYTLRMHSGEGPILVFSDTNNEDGWKYTNDNIGEIINKQKEADNRGFSYKPYFVIYTQVNLEDGQVINTSKLPIYNK